MDELNLKSSCSNENQDIVDIEDIISTKKRKVPNDGGLQRKKLQLSKSDTPVTQQGPDDNTCSVRGTLCRKENCSCYMNIDKPTTSSHSSNCDQSNPLNDFLQMIHKPKIVSSTARNLTNASNDEHLPAKIPVTRDTENICSENVNQEGRENSSANDLPETPPAIGVVESRVEAPVIGVVESRVEDVADKVDTSQQKLSNEFDGLLEEWDLEKEFSTDSIEDLNLSEWHRCEIVQMHVDFPSCNKILQLRSISTNAVTKCILQGVWTSSNIKPGTIVSVKAHFDSSLCTWIIDNNGGFIVEFCDILMSPTSIVGSVACLRQGVLNYLFSKSARDVDDHSKLLATGSLVHELLQQIMHQGVDSPECIAALIEDIISSSNNVRLLYASNMSSHEGREALLKVVPSIQKFCKRYSFGEATVNNRENDATTPQSADNGAWEGEIKSVIAVEDNYWIPELGLKGKVDITVMAKEKHQLQSQLMPIELKTGVARNSVEHQGQVILYNMMTSQITPNDNGGLLVYLREEFARKVNVGRNEERDIIMLRNRLVEYIAPFFSSQQESDNRTFYLPRPTNNARVCEWCPQKLVCSTFLSTAGEEYPRLPAQNVRRASINHLTPEHLNYVVHWSNLLWLEEKDKPRNAVTDLWNLPAEKRETKGRCICNLQLKGNVRFKDVQSYSHVFEKKNESKLDTNSSQFSSGSVVLVSTPRRVAIAFGVIENFDSSSVTVDISRDLSQVRELYGDSYMLDVHEPQSFLRWVLGNLAALLEDTERAANLRRLLINCELPSFNAICNDSSELSEKSQFTLNDSQMKAIKMAIAAKDYLLLRGLPGSGKSTTIAILIQQFVSQGHTVLLTANTHSAVDTVLLKLLKLDVPFMRIGSLVRVHEAIHPWTEHNLTKHCSTPEQLENIYKKQTVVASTCMGVKHTMFTRHTFDVCIVDESTQVLQPVVLGPLLQAKKFILVGDPKQLPPVVRNPIASENGLSTCLFTYLDRPEATVSLGLQYRMNSKITNLANILTYHGALKCASPAVAEATLRFPVEKTQESRPGWMSKALSCKIEDSIVFMNVSKIQEKTTDCINKEEALVVRKLIECFVQAGINSDSIGVMAPYRNQVKYIISLIQDISGIETKTIDQYQGRDKDIVIFACTNNWRSNNISNLDCCILKDERRLTVAITRAKIKLIIIGNILALQGFAPIKHIIDSLDSSNIVQVPDC